MSLSGPTSTRVTWFENSHYFLRETWGFSRVENLADYFFVFFAAQKAFNLADNFALVAGLIRFFFAFAAGWAERVADLARRRFAHLAF